MRLTYDEAVDAAYIYLVEIESGGVAATVPGEPGSKAFDINLDFDSQGRLVGIEVLGASSKLPADFLGRFANRFADPSD
jgi:uncharacterized protein YuzE